MHSITVEAFADDGHPEGGYAIIVLGGLTELAPRPRFRLKPVDVGGHADPRTLWSGKPLLPVTACITERGAELVVGPDVVGHPMLLAGTPVVIELAEAGVRGEFLWPNVRPLAMPKRRHTIVVRKPANDGRAPRDSDVAPIAEAASSAFTSEGLGEIDLRTPPPLPVPVVVKADTAAGTIGGVAKASGSEPSAKLPAIVSGAGSAAELGAILSGGKAAKGNATALQWRGADSGRSGTRGWLLPAATFCGVLGLALVLWPLLKPAAPLSGSAALPKSAGPVAAAASAAARGPAAPETPTGDAASNPAVASSAGSGTTAAGPCGAPEIVTQSLGAGLMRLSATSACRAKQDVVVEYGGARLMRGFDARGRLDTTIDAFAERTAPVELTFADGSQRSVAVTAKDLDAVTKIALIWRAPVNLDLHAFEYAAVRGEPGHVWAGAPSSLEAARAETEPQRRGRGFLSTRADDANAGPDGDRLEVYTLVHVAGQAPGTIALAVDYETRGELPVGATCGTGAMAEVPFSIVQLSASGQVSRQTGQFAAVACGTPLTADARYLQAALPIIKIRK